MMSGRGGTESALNALGKGLQELGDEVRLYLLGGASPDTAWLRNIQHTIVGDPSDSRFVRFRKYSLGLAGEFRAYRPDVVVALDAFRLLKGKLALRLAMLNAPTVSWIHFPLAQIKHPGLLKLADGHLAISEGVAGQLHGLLGPRARDKVATIYNGIGMNKMRIGRSATEVTQFLSIGRLDYEGQKRVGDLLTAAAKLKGNFELTIVGDGDDRGRLEEYGRRMGLDSKIHWLGWKNEPWSFVTTADCLLLTSSYEGFPMILLEALSRGVPCISTDCEFGPSEVIEPGRNGWIYPVGDVEALRELMQAIMDDPTILPLGDVAVASIEKFSVRAVAERAHQALDGFRAVN
jgi:UDP-D-galactose:(glucosyl)LPS alpha-1,6-D-galactosyltransferase